MLRRVFSDYGMVLVLLGLCIMFSVLTLKRQMPEGAAAVKEIARQIERKFEEGDAIVAVGAVKTVSAVLAEDVSRELKESG